MARLLSFVLLLGFAPLAEATVVISEVLADPPSGLAGDANQDGVRETYGDEFIELYNAGSAPVDINGWRLGDSGKSPDTFFQFQPTRSLNPARSSSSSAAAIQRDSPSLSLPTTDASATA